MHATIQLPLRRIIATAEDITLHTMLTVAKMEVGSAIAIADRVAEFDAGTTHSMLVRRQLFHYHGDLFLHLRDYRDATAAWAHDESDGLYPCLSPHLLAFDPQVPDGPWNAAAISRYLWRPTGVGAGVHSTIVVNRLEPELWSTVVELFADFDRTDVPGRMGTRRRQLVEYRGVYFHIQDFDVADGDNIIDQAWRTAHPRFIKICEDLDPLITKYDTATWRRPADALATRFYHWETA